jgi:hypothetical protein
VYITVLGLDEKVLAHGQREDRATKNKVEHKEMYCKRSMKPPSVVASSFSSKECHLD